MRKIYICLLIAALCSVFPIAAQMENTPQAQFLRMYRYSGTASEMAQRWGEQEKEHFERVYKEVTEKNGMSGIKETLLSWVTLPSFAPYLDEETKAEIEAFAKGANTTYDKVLAVNCFYDILHNCGCRQAVAWGEKTEDGSLIHGRNLDWNDWGSSLRDNNIFLLRKYPKGNAIATMTWPGLLGCLTGCNDKGLTIAFNQIGGENDTSGEPVFLILKRALREANTIEEAVKIIKKSHFFTNGSVMISSSVEKSAVVVKIVHPNAWVRKAEGDSFIGNNNTCYFDNDGKYLPDEYKQSDVYQVLLSSKKLNILELQSVMAHKKIMMRINLLTSIFCLEKDTLTLACGQYKAAQGTYQTIPLFKAATEDCSVKAQPEKK